MTRTSGSAYDGQALVEILPTDDRFISTNCTLWLPYRPPPDPSPGFDDGVYLVGRDIEPGLYVGGLDAARENECRWERRPALDPPRPLDREGYDEWLLGRFGSAEHAVAEILPGDFAFSSSGCRNWRRIESYAEIPPRIEPPAEYGDGLWLVGSEMPTGRYASEHPPGLEGDCIWARFTSFTGEVESVAIAGHPAAVGGGWIEFWNRYGAGAIDAAAQLRRVEFGALAEVEINDADVAFFSYGCPAWRRAGW